VSYVGAHISLSVVSIRYTQWRGLFERQKLPWFVFWWRLGGLMSRSGEEASALDDVTLKFFIIF
jgi:hypothetical protein